ncbi:MAG: lipid A phosphoethanolamine transferase [Muribaculaceae bacterium]|nr:lipid A phosphoethanolamine transferase [Muribaculaceae bacterium]MDE6332700.1 lipid A phosphoethanolamine transferase [Muribaculaceae bacterium]
MKHSKIITATKLLLWVYPLLLIVPNIWLSFSEPYAAVSKTVNLTLPLGAYYLIVGMSRRSGLAVTMTIPIAFFCAFQIVLLYLYGESIIAIDMFMNVATTNVSEASELLGNLSLAIITVLLLYVPPLAFGVWLIWNKTITPADVLRNIRLAGASLVCVGFIAMASAYASCSDYSARRELFPMNVACNLVDAALRVRQAADYMTTSEKFNYHAVNLRHDSIPEIYVLVIGETSRADNWQIFGYDRQTNPRLSRRPGLLKYPRTLSESNTTHKSVPMLLSCLHSGNFKDSVFRVKSIFEAFNETGANTIFLSNQPENHSYIDFYTSQAREVRRICSDGITHHDHELLDCLSRYIAGASQKQTFIVLHTYGSHYCYNERYTNEFRKFIPDNATDASSRNRPDLINAYDNSIVYTDALLDSIIDMLDTSGCRSAMVYTSDHGEDIFDDRRGRFLHASPTPTYWQLHVPMLVWMSDEFRAAYPALYSAAYTNQPKAVSSTLSVFDTLLDLAGIASDSRHPDQSLCKEAYNEPSRRYLNDYNEGVPLDDSGLKAEDFILLKNLEPVRQ